MSDQKPDKNSKINVIRFAFGLSLVCSLLITAAASGLKGFQQENIALDKKINLLKAVGLVQGKKPAKQEINVLYDTHIQEVRVDGQGKIIDPGNPGLEPAKESLQLYFFVTGDTIEGYILPINTKGLWGKIQGYLAFENDGQTVSGFSVFSHAETPGLGGEIESNWFQKSFKGKKILNSQDEFVSVGIAKGKIKNLPPSDQTHFVDGISGATLTGQYLSEGIESTLVKYEAVSISFRQKELKTKKPSAQGPENTREITPENQ